MSDTELEGEELGEQKEVHGEGGPPTIAYSHVTEKETVIPERNLGFEEASRGLHILGKDESGIRYAYLMMTVTDRKLTNVDVILKFRHILFIDISGNYLNLDALQVLADMPYLVLLKAQSNRIEAAALRPIHFMQVLDLNRNKISETCDINQPMLDTLQLSHNQIYMAQFDVERLAELKQLELRGNHLFDVSGSYPVSVENLYLAENKITKIIPESISKLVNLKRLHLRDNHLRKLDGFTSYLVNLNYLNVRKNRIKKFRQFRKLKCLPKLEVLIVLENPVSGYDEKKGEGAGNMGLDEEGFGEDGPIDPCRLPLLVLLPKLKRINKDIITSDDRDKAAAISDKKLKEIMAEESSDEETEIPSTTDFTTDYTTEPETLDDEI